MLLRAALLVLASASHVLADNWAVIVAGSNSWWNYRHQADLCHAYHILRRNGIDADKVIVMSYDDVPTSSDNPVPGTLFNKPTPEGHPGWDVRKHCDIDYTGSDVTAANFLAVLKGDAAATGGKPVLASTAEDRVFISFFDHGAPGLIAMPEGEPVYAADFMEALRHMSEHAMFAELVIYLESCESGSMFEGLLPEDAKIWAITAADPHESSWGTYCSGDSSVNGVDIGSCLGDLFSVMWMENSDQVDLFHTETLETQLELVRDATTQSHVQRYGDSSLQQVPIEEFQGRDGFPSFSNSYYHSDSDAVAAAETVARLPVPRRGVNSRDITLHTLQYMNSKAAASGNAQQQLRYATLLAKETAHRAAADALFTAFVDLGYTHNDAGDAGDGGVELRIGSAGAATATQTLHSVMHTQLGPLQQLQCHKPAHTAVMQHCGSYSDYSLQYARVVAHMCETAYSAEHIAAVAATLCTADIRQHMVASVSSTV